MRDLWRVVQVNKRRRTADLLDGLLCFKRVMVSKQDFPTVLAAFHKYKQGWVVEGDFNESTWSISDVNILEPKVKKSEKEV